MDRYDPAEAGSQWFSQDSLDITGRLRPAFGLTGDIGYQPQRLTSDGTMTTLAGEVPLVSHQAFVHLGAAVVLVERLRVGLELPLAVSEDGNALVREGVLYEPPSGGGVGDPAAQRRRPRDRPARGPVHRRAGGGPVGAAREQERVPRRRRGPRRAPPPRRGRRRPVHLRRLARLPLPRRPGQLLRGQADWGRGHGGSGRGRAPPRPAPAARRRGLRRNGHHGQRQLPRQVHDVPRGARRRALRVRTLARRRRHRARAHERRGRADGARALHVRVGAGGGGPPVATPAPLQPSAPPSDRDGDGVPDAEDACPDAAGVRSANPAKDGCPPPPADRAPDPPPADRDGDGIPDAADACPDVAGPPSDDPAKNGCPPPASRPDKS